MSRALKRSDLNRIDQGWQKKVMCEYCGFQMVVNNYEDRKSRTPKFFGLPICPSCDPRALSERWDKNPRIVFPIKYRTCASVVLVRKLSQLQRSNANKDDIVALLDKVEKFFVKGQPVDQPEMRYETDRKIYGKVQVQD